MSSPGSMVPSLKVSIPFIQNPSFPFPSNRLDPLKQPLKTHRPYPFICLY
ncbi:hypothetical protein HETIRDRAFT_416760 [Heterobasidion irregulare TC 32-1]|uniref:Uncharacterized protein n=1 Tax=Heterobasidion irregulare (strain TC 32-1) TaxID=747525 RepID=W4K9X6_HETIT|nr:uncharacterized protein HETIRDRAFT_416760 [Heterobasidion irregulare TC 32-1]ETW82647.1 hypothetical protein HETIRDRAFT_416760 [Heterobasidion irregulare TC 32-1]